MQKAKIWYEENKRIMLTAVILGLAWVFLHSVSIAARENSQPWFVNQVLRLHIVAHGDTPEEQALKLAIRDGIWPYLDGMTIYAANMDEARAIVSENLPYIEAAASRIIQESGAGHAVTVDLVQNQHFPTMSYGGIIFPQGRYEALQITIGDGAGSNWWCVMFPSMCMMDIARGEVIELPEEASDEIIIRPRFRLAEALQNIFH
ncbi:MAG: stage II sporulation protein R [Defluviitaleaceae bacterium]|nr:stage II sporulation protein R [Defluviitaleaceae bacterium]